MFITANKPKPYEGVAIFLLAALHNVQLMSSEIDGLRSENSETVEVYNKIGSQRFVKLPLIDIGSRQ